MKPTLVLILCCISSMLSAQQLKTLINKAKQTTSIISKEGSQPEISAGLKEALAIGVEKGIAFLSVENGFFGNSLYKIVMPPEAQKVEKALRGIGLGAKVDEAILSMNRGAEEAVNKAAPIFTGAIKNMNITDAIGILRSADTAATGYLRKKTSTSLASAFRPVIEESLEKSGASTHWNSIMTNYNNIALQKVNTDLTGYVTDKALQALFIQIADQEKKIRKDPSERTSELLKTVFNKN